MIVRGVAVVGGFVFDNQSTDEPSGVIRAYDVTSGKLVWAWDGVHPDARAAAQARRRSIARGTPNSWTVDSADEALGLVYIADRQRAARFLRRASRKPGWDEYGSSIVALDAATGNVRWSVPDDPSRRLGL